MVHLKFKICKEQVKSKFQSLRTALNFKILNLWRLDKIPSPRKPNRILKFYNFKIPLYFVFFAPSLLVVAFASM